MALILHIDTATEHASVCLSADGALLAIETNANQKDHAAFLQPAVERLLKTSSKEFKDIDAIAVSNGPGSYTGLRVGLSSAKGYCFALGKPLILINTLEVMAFAAIEEYHRQDNTGDKMVLFSPMIDARRMEVFTAVYTKELTPVVEPYALILTGETYESLLREYTIVFTGSGAVKLKSVVENDNTFYLNIQHDARHMQTIAEKLYLLKAFADTAYSEPFYLKEFFTNHPKLKSDIKTS